MRHPLLPAVLLLAGVFAVLSPQQGLANGNVYVSRFWHNHQPLYWPEWNYNGSQTNRGQYAWDSIVLKPGQNYGGLSPKQHPENDLVEIFGKDDRRNAYQFGPKNSLQGIDSRGGFGISYSGSLIDNVRQLGSLGQLGYGNNWNQGIRDARGWKTPAGSTRMDMLGFTYHHSLGPLLPKSVYRKEIQAFKQAWWKAWGGKSDLSDHSKGFFPTEMAYSRHLIDVLVDEGFEWTLVASHHISRTSPSYNDRANPTGSYNIFSSPPNRADQISPRFDNADQWWYGEPNPGNAAWNVAPFAYQLHRVKYVDPVTGAEKRMFAVPSDDVLSYRYGYANEGVGKIDGEIAPHANVPVIVVPSTDGDNAWGGGASSWGEATAQLFGDSANRGYKPAAMQDFVNAVKGTITNDTHIEDGAWIFPEMCYGSPNFMKWIEPPVANAAISATNRVPGTQIDMETPGFALKFFSYAPLMAGANWLETAEQILREENGGNDVVNEWKIATPYDWDGTWTQPNDVELAWHIYLKGLDSGFNYYGGLGNDDEVKPALATKNAIDRLQNFMTPERKAKDKVGPTLLKPQRFPYNPGEYTFGWFNEIPGGDRRFLKRMNSEFYIWTHAYDLSGINESNVVLKIRIDSDGNNPIDSNQNETYAGGNEVGTWVEIPMTKRVLPKTRTALNAAAANGQIDYFVFDPAFWSNPVVADYYFAKVNDANLAGFRDKLLDYYIEAKDTRGNISRSDIQHVWVGNFNDAGSGGGGGGGGGGTPVDSVVSVTPSPPVAGQPVTITYNPSGRNLSSASNVYLHYAPGEWNTQRVIPRPAMTPTNIGTVSSPTNVWRFTTNLPANATILRMVFTANPETSSNLAWDNNGGANWNFSVTNAPPTQVPPVPVGLNATASSSTSVSVSWNAAATASSYILTRNGLQIAAPQGTSYADVGLLPESTNSYSVRASNGVGLSEFSAPVTVITPFTPVAPTNISILAPASATTTSSNVFRFVGRAGGSFSAGLIWSNTASGQTGSIPLPVGNVTNGWAWNADIPLVEGANSISVSGLVPITQTNPFTDSPMSYNTWEAGQGQGTGFGAWFTNHSASNAGSFLANSPTNMNLGAGVIKGFGLWANNGGRAAVTRAFNSPMKTGDVFNLRFDNNWISNGSRVGMEFRDTSGTVRLRFSFLGGENTYRVVDAQGDRLTQIAYTDGGLDLSLALGASNAYTLNTGSGVVIGNLVAGGLITWMEFFNQNAGPDTPHNVYIGPMTHLVATTGNQSFSQNTAVIRDSSSGSTDGLPNTWWNQYFGTTDGMSAAADPDSDSFSNAQEHALGTDPTSNASALRITSIAREGTNTTVAWTAVGGKTYQLEGKPALGSLSWSNMASAVIATNNATNAFSQHGAIAEQHFYRVRLVTPQ